VMTNTQGSAIKLTGAKLRDVDATGAVWTTADLVEARLHKTNLTKADLSGSDMTEASFQEAILTEANLESVIALRARFQQANLQKARLVGARFEEANLQGADLTGADLERCDLRRANLTGAILKDAKLRGCILADAVLEGVDLAGLDLADVDLTGVDPRTVGLSAEQLGTVAKVGAAADENAPLRFTDVSLARKGTAAAVLWENMDSEETLSLRWALFKPGKKPKKGVLPVSAEGVLARAVAATADGFVLLVLQERPGGAALLRYSLSIDGDVGTAKVDPLGYEPGVRPVVRNEGGSVWIWGLARRGPTLVVQKLTETGLETVASNKIPTARGFIGGHFPVLACKGGVVIPASVKGAGEPLRTPPQFPARLPVAVGHEDRVLVLWVEEDQSDEVLGGIRYAWLGRGPAPKVQVLTMGGEIHSLDAISTSEGAWVAWTQLGGELGDGAWFQRLPDGTPERLGDIEGDELEELRFADEAPGDPGLPLVALTTVDEAVLVADLDGRPIGGLGGSS
jgi:uncharacterized protein YjbI with pentapeptide repeats